ncbi:cupin domain-containing protein [Leisingera sp. M523]|uniref:cupin domain-containing protein n=1 Tax=Leisingera sp. M523 TaxID=2867013 RepID=UPI0021A70096|nr:cupin domain-containing protein [Leisingera sp. M523]UWQ29307.1 cupin domain-containing protein [Leisingera sp. M523]
MRINAELDQPVTVHASSLDWTPSPTAGVERKMLYREGGEVARATSIARYAPGSAFPAHVHSGGEEILVLYGIFQDEHGDYPAGTYFRNPPGTSHSPAAVDGCTIFVRLWQFRDGDAAQIVRMPGEGGPGEERQGVKLSNTLFEDGAERVLLEEWEPGVAVAVENTRGLELLVLQGELSVRGKCLKELSWLRLPAGHGIDARTGVAGATVWIKDAPLQHPDVLQLPA